MKKQNNPILKKAPKLKDFQKFIIDQEDERGYSTDIFHYCLMLGEEFGELFKVIRKIEGQDVNDNDTELYKIIPLLRQIT